MPAFDGATIDPKQDNKRLSKQLDNVRDYMLRVSAWRSLSQIAEDTGFPEASVSARLRDLRKAKFGGFNVERMRVKDGNGLHVYRIVAARKVVRTAVKA